MSDHVPNLKNIERLTQDALRAVGYYELNGDTAGEDYVFACSCLETLSRMRADTMAQIREAYSLMPLAGQEQLEKLQWVIREPEGC
jgi:hypothetical protein